MDKLIRIVRRIIVTSGVIGLGLFLFTYMGWTATITMNSGDMSGWETAWHIALAMSLPFVSIGVVVLTVWSVVTFLCWLFELKQEQLGFNAETIKRINYILGFDLF